MPTWSFRLPVWSAALLALVVAGCGGMLSPGGDDASAVPAPTDLAATSLPDGVTPADLTVADLAAGPDGPVCFPDLLTIELAPANSMVTLNGQPAAPIAFTVKGTFKDGHSAMLDPARLDWSATRGDDTPPGTVKAGVLQPFPRAGGTVTVTATDGCVKGSTTVIFNLQVTVGAPVDPNAWAAMPVAGPPPTIVYPSNNTRFPRNIYRTLFQWRSGGLKEFRLTFEGPGAKVVVFTDGAHALCAKANPAAGCWEADENAWSYIAGSNAGATVTWTLDALDRASNPPKVTRATPITIGFSRRDVAGAIFYWSTTSAGIRRANIADAMPENYLTGKPGTVYQNNTIQCVACHTVSRDGKYLLAPVQATNSKSLWVTQVTQKPPPTPLVTNIASTGGHGFATISPDDATVVAAWGGDMWTVDRATGKADAMLPLGKTQATHPDWSPDDTQLVFATGNGDAPGGASIAVIPWMKPNWGAPKVIVPAGNQSNLFPMFSGDGKWIAYSRGKGGHGDLTAQLWIVPGAGGTPVELVSANRVVSNQTTNGQFENSQPTWAPSGDYDWIAFNSVREYGVVQPLGTQQIWVAAIDRGKLAMGQDGSFPAFRLQFQGLAENNHRAFWTLDVRDAPPPPDGGVPVDMSGPPPPDMSLPPPDLKGAPDLWHCIGRGQVCDPITDTCCDTNYVCDTTDNGMTYTCIPGVG